MQLVSFRHSSLEYIEVDANQDLLWFLDGRKLAQRLEASVKIEDLLSTKEAWGHRAVQNLSWLRHSFPLLVKLIQDCPIESFVRRLEQARLLSHLFLNHLFLAHLQNAYTKVSELLHVFTIFLVLNLQTLKLTRDLFLLWVVVIITRFQSFRHCHLVHIIICLFG